MKRTLILSASMLGLITAATPALAQDYDDEVIVTATKRAQSVQDIPIAVTAISPDKLAEQGVVNIQNLTSVAPSFSTSNAQTSSGTVVLRIRGVGTTSNNIGFESAVGVFVDGVYQSRPGVALGEFVDVERVEVLRGPQGTLFGRNTSAGALNITNVRPDLDESGGFVNATFGNYGHFSTQGAVNIPLAEGKVAARITGAYRDRDGYIDVVDRDGNRLGDTNSLDQFMLRGQIGFEGDSGINGRVIADYTESKASCCGAVEILQSPLETGGTYALVGLGPRGGMAGPIVATDPTDNATAEDAVAELTATSNQVPENRNDQWGITAEVEIPVSDNVDAVYIGSYRAYEASEAYDSAFSGLDIFNVVDGSDLEIDTMTHELRFQGTAMDGRFDWLVGGYYSQEEIFQNTNFELGADFDQYIGGAFGNALGPRPLALLTGGQDASQVSTTNQYRQDSKSFSLFTHNIFSITDALDLTVGLRYSDESKDGSFTQPRNNNPVCTALLSTVNFAQGGPAFGATPAAFFPSILGTGCFAFTAPADLPQAFPGSYPAPLDGVFFPLPRTFDGKFKDDELIYTGKLSYEFTPDMTAYAGFTHGYKSGGFNLDSTAAAGGADPRFASETVDAYEIGLKTRLMDGRVTLNVAAFLQEFEDFQVLEFTGAQFQTFNVPKAESKGIEIEAQGQLTDSLSFNGGLTLLEAEYPDDCATADDAVRVQNLCGFDLTNAPRTVGILGAKYEGDINSALGFFLAGQVRYEGDRRTSTQGRLVPNAAAITAAGSVEAAIDASPLNPLDVQESTVKINLRAGISDEDKGWALEAWATNLTDERTRGVTFNTVLRSGSRSAFPQEPRMYGVTARKNF